MAKSGNFSKTFSTGYTLKVSWSESNVDTSNNQSDITCTVTLSATGSYNISSTASKNISLTINGTTYNSTCTVGLSAGGSKTLMTKTVANINHGSDGSKSVSISCTLGIAVTLNGSYVSSVSTSGTATLTKIARLSSMSVSNGTLNTSQTITISKEDSSFKHKITYLCGDASGYAAGGSDSFTTATSVSWAPPLSFASKNTTGTSVSIRLRLYTFTSGGTNLGYTEKTITCSIPSSVKPSCTIALEDASGYQSTYGWLKGLSKIKYTVTPTISYGSPIKSYNVTVKNTTYTTASGTTGTLGSSGTINITAKVTDARGRSGSTSTSITVVDYTAPVINKLQITRCDSNGTENMTGEYISIQYSTTVTPLSNKNTASVILKYKKATSTSYTSQSLSTAYSASGTKIISADSGSAYDVVLSVSDKFKTTTRTTSASTGFAIMHFGSDGKSIAIGKIVEESNLFDVGLNARFRKGISQDIQVINTDLNTLAVSGYFYCGNDCTNRPVDRNGYLESFVYPTDTSFKYQRYIAYDGIVFERVCHAGTWDQWCGRFISGDWTVHRHLNGLLEIWGAIKIENVTVSTAMGSLYRSSTVFSSTDHPYPMQFVAEPSVNMTYVTTNGYPAWLWLTTPTDMKKYPGGCYLVRHNSGNTTSGYIYINASGRWK